MHPSRSLTLFVGLSHLSQQSNNCLTCFSSEINKEIHNKHQSRDVKKQGSNKEKENKGQETEKLRDEGWEGQRVGRWEGGIKEGRQEGRQLGRDVGRQLGREATRQGGTEAGKQGGRKAQDQHALTLLLVIQTGDHAVPKERDSNLTTPAESTLTGVPSSENL